METTVKPSSRRMSREKILVDIPRSDMAFFRLFADKFGWQLVNKQILWKEYMKNSPKNVDLSEEEIMEEVRAVQYGKV
ncbi:MAG: hypothetical protein FWF09_09005 [Bacteroidales bacterium]|nr:hypothetical protein [Bacteroidales bacterium]